MIDLHSNTALPRDSATEPGTTADQRTASQEKQGSRTLRRTFHSATMRADTKSELIAGMLDSLVRLPDVLGAVWYTGNGEECQPLDETRLPTSLVRREGVLAWLRQCGTRVIGSRETLIEPSSKVRGLLAVTQAVPFSDGTVDAVVVLFKNPDGQGDVGPVLVQLLVANVVAWELRQQHKETSGELRATAAVLELVERAVAAETLPDATSLVANELHKFLGSRYVAVGLRKQDAGCRLETVSGLAEFDRNSPLTRAFEAALDETVVCNDVTSWPPREDSNSRQLLAHRKLVETIGVEAVVGVPLRTVDGAVLGVLACAGRSTIVGDPRVGRLIASAGPPIGGALHVARRAQGGRLQRAARAFFSSRWTTGRRLILAVTVALGLLMMVPMPYRVRCRCTTEPVLRRFSVAPYDGLLENTFAEPGDVVKKGQLLARMDGREIRWELAGITADHHQADKERDVHLARHHVAEALAAELKMESLDARSKLLKYRAEHLEIRAPVDGIVLSGSIDRRENYPVSVGKMLYEIAPLASIRVEVAVPAEEAGFVDAKMPVEIHIDGQGPTPMRGEIARIRPRSEIRGDENVFVAEAIVPNDSGVLRPGMTGTARVVGERHALGWNLFHRAWERAVAFLRW